MAKEKEKNHVVISTRGLLAAVVAGVGILSGIGVLHTTFVLPSIITEAREMTEKLIETHTKYPHPVSVSRVEFESMKQSLSEFRADTKAALARIERKIDQR